MFIWFFFFFKQKTAYEMRISDWSSDVCSSDLPYQRFATKDGYMMIGAGGQSIWVRCAAALGHPEWVEDSRFLNSRERMKNRPALEAAIEAVLADGTTDHWVTVLEAAGVPCGPVRSEEHTSELQSLMRISYAVFCLK